MLLQAQARELAWPPAPACAGSCVPAEPSRPSIIGTNNSHKLIHQNDFSNRLWAEHAFKGLLQVLTRKGQMQAKNGCQLLIQREGELRGSIVGGAVRHRSRCCRSREPAARASPTQGNSEHCIHSSPLLSPRHRLQDLPPPGHGTVAARHRVSESS